MNSDILAALNALEQKVYQLELELTMLRNAVKRHDHCPFNPDRPPEVPVNHVLSEN